MANARRLPNRGKITFSRQPVKSFALEVPPMVSPGERRDQQKVAAMLLVRADPSGHSQM